MSEPVRIGIVGCGEIAQLMHLPYLSELPEFEVTAICDLSVEVLEAVGGQYGVQRRYQDVQDLVRDPEVDAVVICTFDHFDVAMKALDARKHVLIEKPLSFTVSEAALLEARAEEVGVVASIGYMKLFDEGFKVAKKRVSGIDYLRSATVHDYAGRFDLHGSLYTQHRGTDVPAAVLEAGRDEVGAKVAEALGPDHAGYVDLYLTLLMLGSHDLAVMRTLFGATQAVQYAVQTEDSSILAVLELEQVSSCVFELGFGASYEWWDEFVAGYGMKESFRLDFENPYLRQAPAAFTWREGAGEHAVTSRLDPLQHSAFRTQWLHFADCVRGRSETASPLSGGVEDVKTALALIKALPPKGA